MRRSQYKSYHEQEGLYFSLIQKVGSWHRYQFYLFIIIAGIFSLQASLIFIPPYLFHQSQYQCTTLAPEECQIYVCSLPEQLRTDYQKYSPFFSLADQLGDFRCQNYKTLSFLQSIIFLSIIFGLMLSTFVVEKFGLKNALSMSLGCVIIGLSIILFNKQIWLIAIGIIFMYAGIETAYQYVNCLPTEVIEQTKRTRFCDYLNLVYGLAIMIDSFAFFGLKSWRYVFIFIFLIPSILIFLGSIFIIQKTPLDLIKHQKPQYMYKSLKRIQQMNGIKQSSLDFNLVQALYLKYKPINRKHGDTFTIIDIMRYKSLRKIFIPLGLLNFIAVFLFLSPTMVIKLTSNNKLFTDNIVAGLSAILSMPFVSYLEHRYSRRCSGIFLMLLMLTCSFSMILSINQLLKSLIFFVLRMAITIELLIVLGVNYESYPTQIREIAGLTTYSFGNMAGIALPWIAQICNKYHVSAQHSFVIIIIVGIVSICFIKETYNAPETQIIYELRDSRTFGSLLRQLNQDRADSRRSSR